MAAPLYPVPSTSTSIDLKANGEVSRMRSHKGNMPSLPQTKYCPLCPAKFTRTTHLNRHLRSHTNERLHRCNVCHAEFTRSDLLTRHKRTCGDSINANRSRRKSCQACAESKVKCNLQYPCAKCSARGRECVFINDPEASRNKKNASRKPSSRSVSSKLAAESNSIALPTNRASDSSQSPPSASPVGLLPAFHSHGSTAPPNLPVHSTFSILPSSLKFEIPTLTNSPGSSVSSSHSSPRSDYFETRPDIAGSFDPGFATSALDTHLNQLFSSDMFEAYLEETYSPCSPQSGGTSEFTWLEGSELYTGYGEDVFPFPSTGRYDDQEISSEYATLRSNSSVGPSPGTSTLHLPTITPVQPPRYGASSAATAGNEPATAELDHYLFLFFSAFSTQVPLIHLSTWNRQDKPPMLIRAMQACGALFIKTRAAMNFIAETLASTRDALIQEFAKSPSDSGEQIDLILTVVLLQTIGLFHQRADQRVSSSVYHGMLVMMIRRTGLISRIGAWVPPDLSDARNLNTAWKQWVNYETVKRAVFLSYLHDCCHCMYFSLSPSFQPSELDISLPCDDALWSAGNARDWYKLSRGPSAYGTGNVRISGFGMQRALGILGEMELPAAPPSLNPFAHFVLIHTILRNLYAPRAQNSESRTAPHTPTDVANRGDESSDNTLAAQYALHSWLQMWQNGPESGQAGKGREEPPFVCNALPFYWLAQVSLLAIQDKTSILSGKLSAAKGEDKFRLMKQWLDHIRTFLRNGTQTPAHLWDGLASISAQTSQGAGQVGSEHIDGVLAFFQGN